MSTTLRLAYLRALRAIGVKKFVTKSASGHPFLCHLGDFLGENPFYNGDLCRSELNLCGAWLSKTANPIAFDVGAHVGFFSTQLAQMLDQSLEIYAFEPVPATFTKLVQSIDCLGLNNRVYPIAAAVLDDSRVVRLSYSSRNSLFSQVSSHGLNPRFGEDLVNAASVTLDGFCSTLGIHPALIKLDVEGSEVPVLRGARHLLSRTDRPALCFEYNPQTLSECGWTTRALAGMFVGYRVYYVDDFEDQKLPIGTEIREIDKLNHVCNLFAVPVGEQYLERWNAVVQHMM